MTCPSRGPIRCSKAFPTRATFISCTRTTSIRKIRVRRWQLPSTASTSPRLSSKRTSWRRSSILKRAPTWVCGCTRISVGSPPTVVFTPIPAVDIRGGRCVRLVQGDFSRETRYADDPADMARHWEAEGAQRLHVVDLDGARDGVRANADVIGRLLRSVAIPVQVGGGIRSLDTAQRLLDDGADRV